MPETGHRDFALRQFPGTLPLLSLEISGNIQRQGRRLGIRSRVSGPLGEVLIPGAAALPERRDGLWEETCFEFFLAIKGTPRYWEFNLSPAGHWNVYRFSAYRQGMAEEQAFRALPFSVGSGSGSLLLALELDLAGIVKTDQALEAAIAAVIKLKRGGKTYWALAHPGPQADFHHRQGFSIAL